MIMFCSPSPNVNFIISTHACTRRDKSKRPIARNETRRVIIIIIIIIVNV